MRRKYKEQMILVRQSSVVLQGNHPLNKWHKFQDFGLFKSELPKLISAYSLAFYLCIYVFIYLLVCVCGEFSIC